MAVDDPSSHWYVETIWPKTNDSAASSKSGGGVAGERVAASGLEPGALDGRSPQWVLKAVGAAAPAGQVVVLAAGT